jgi:hypothetical protein
MKKLLILLFLAGLVNADTTTGLIAYWPLNETSGNAIDYSGSGMNLLPQHITQSTLGAVFNGNNSFYNITTYTPDFVDNRSQESWGGWLKIGSRSGNQMLTSSGGVNTYRYLSGYQHTSGKFYCFTMDNNSNSLQVLSSIAVTDATNNVWHHIWCNANGTNLNIYVDGLYSASSEAYNPRYFWLQNPTNQINFAVLGVYLNTVWESQDSWLNGTAKGVRVYNRSLSDADILYIVTTTTTTLPVVPVTRKQEYNETMSGSWPLAFWTYWTTVFPAPISFLPVALFFCVVGFMIWLKTRSIIVPAIIALVFLSISGVAVVGYLGVIGVVIFGVVVLALMVAFLKYFW